MRLGAITILMTTGATMEDAGGWLAYLGWVLFVGALMLYYRLWTSAGVDELRKLKEALSEARITIARLQEMELSLKNRNDELSTSHQRLHGEFVELRGQFSQLNVAFAKQGETVARLMEELNAERTKRDDQFMQWTRERARNGDL